MIAPPAWTADAMCTQVDIGDIFYPAKGGSTKAAKRVCSVCPVAAECLQYALDNAERHGIWGGLSEPERRQIAQAAA